MKVIRDYVKLCGVTALGYERFDAAYEAVRASLEFAGNPRMHELLGLIYVIRQQYWLAVQQLGKAAALGPDNAEVRYYYGRALFTVGRISEARDEFLVCLQIRPDYPRASMNLGLCMRN